MLEPGFAEKYRIRERVLECDTISCALIYLLLEQVCDESMFDLSTPLKEYKRICNGQLRSSCIM